MNIALHFPEMRSLLTTGVAVASRPFDARALPSVGVAVNVLEAWSEYEPDDIQGTRVYYRADYPDGECQVRPGVFLTWSDASTMPEEVSRIRAYVAEVTIGMDSTAWTQTVTLRTVAP